LKEYHTRRRRENKYVTSSKKRKSTTFDEKSFHSLADVWLKKKEKFLTDTFDIFLSSNHPTNILTNTNKTLQPTVRASGSGVFDKSKQYADIKEATAAGLDGACAPFPEGLDILGFCKGINGGDLQRFREAEITHGRVSMIATVGFLVGEQVEGSSFLFDAQVTGPAIDHFQQTPGLVWGLVGATIFLLESTRVQKGWSDPFTSELFSLNDDYVPGQWGFDPLGLSNNKTAEDMAEARLKEINNGRLAMISISGMVAQELVNGLNLIPADEVLEEGRGAALVQMGKQCAGAVDEAACAKAFEAAERVAVAAGK
jgi:hypothetical protein